MKPKYKRLLICLAIPLAAGALAALLSGGMADYKTMNKPPLSPPGWLFPLVWTVLYLMMGYASYRVLTSDKDRMTIRRALYAYATQLIFNFLWPILFFGFGWILTSFFLLIALWILIYITLRLFSAIDEHAGDLLLPYILWVTFAGYSNLGIFLLN